MQGKWRDTGVKMQPSGRANVSPPRIFPTNPRPDDDDDIFYLFCRNKNQPKAIYPKGTSNHTGLFGGPITNGM
jgi:hypothetical protein